MKVRRIFQFQSIISFPDFDQYFNCHLSSFYASDLGKIYLTIPWDEMVCSLGLKGSESIFSPVGSWF